jgi:hypothetical protein
MREQRKPRTLLYSRNKAEFNDKFYAQAYLNQKKELPVPESYETINPIWP